MENQVSGRDTSAGENLEKTIIFDSELKLYYQNVRSVRNKLQSSRVHDIYYYDFIALTET